MPWSRWRICCIRCWDREGQQFSPRPFAKAPAVLSRCFAANFAHKRAFPQTDISPLYSCKHDLSSFFGLAELLRIFLCLFAKNAHCPGDSPRRSAFSMLYSTWVSTDSVSHITIISYNIILHFAIGGIAQMCLGFTSI